jgi:hypothetical protein
MRNYDCVRKKTNVFGNWDMEACYPKEHSRVKALICEFRRANTWDDYPGDRAIWTRYLAILWKDARKWEIISTTDENYTWVTSGLGIYPILETLEDDEYHDKQEIEKMKKFITDYQMYIKKYTQDIKDLRKKMKQKKNR